MIGVFVFLFVIETLGCFHESTIIFYGDRNYTKSDLRGTEDCVVPYTIRNKYGYTLYVRCDPPFSNTRDIMRNVTLSNYHVVYTLDRGLQPVKNLRIGSDVVFGDLSESLQCMVYNLQPLTTAQSFFALECTNSNQLLASGIKCASFQISNLSSIIN
jgi:hypothetical protein